VAAILRQAQQRHPDDFWVNFELGSCLYHLRPPRLEEAIRYYTAAVAVRPESIAARENLGIALADKGKLDEAIVQFRQAIRHQPDHASTHNSLGRALYAKGELDEAIACYRKAIALDPKFAYAHNNRGNALKDKGKVDEAIACFHKAIALDPKYASAHYNLGNALDGKGQLDEAIACYRKAIALDPKLARARMNLGIALYLKGQVDEGMLCLKRAIELDPKDAMAHCNLGRALVRKGQFKEGVEALRLGHQLGSRRADWPYPSAEWVRQAEQLACLDDRLSAVLASQASPKDAAERLGFAQLCQQHRQRYAAAARFYAEAFVGQPALTDDRRSQHRYNAACAAALAGCGHGKDAASLTEAERGRLRTQALAWLRADLKAWRRLVEKEGVKARPVISKLMQHWLTDPDFNGVRGPHALAKWPEAERAAWHDLWAGVADTLARARKPAPPKKQPGKEELLPQPQPEIGQQP
jgi:tetratricopeptide (TPR) repeat protein